MDTRNFDRISATLAASRDRRDTVRLLGASILGIGGIGILSQESDARRKRKRRGKKGRKGGRKKGTRRKKAM